MIESVRTLETDNEHLKLSLQTASSTQTPPVTRKTECGRCLNSEEKHKQLMLKIISLEKECNKQNIELQKVMSGNKADLSNLLKYHRNYPRENFKSLAERLRTEAYSLQRNLVWEQKRNKEFSEKLRRMEPSVINNTTPGTPTSSSPSLANRFTILSQEENSPVEDGFVEVQRKNRKKKSKKHIIQHKQQLNKKEECLKTSLKHVKIVGDSHARGLAGLLLNKIQPPSNVYGICKPNARLVEIEQSCIPTQGVEECVVILAGSNDVANGTSKYIFEHLEPIITRCASSTNVLVSTLPYRHDLPPHHHINDTISLVNGYIEELCQRMEGVEILQFNTIGRKHFTSQGMHLRPSGKLMLTQLLAEKLARMSPRRLSPPEQPTPRRRPRDNTASTDPPETSPPRPSPRTLPHDTFADAVKHSPSSSLQEKKTKNPVFLGTPLLAKGQN